MNFNKEIEDVRAELRRLIEQEVALTNDIGVLADAAQGPGTREAINSSIHEKRQALSAYQAMIKDLRRRERSLYEQRVKILQMEIDSPTTTLMETEEIREIIRQYLVQIQKLTEIIAA